MTPVEPSAAEADTTVDAFLGGAVMIEQPATGYRAGLDAVLLAAACKPQEHDHVLDAGAGVGVVGLSLARRFPLITLCLVEREPRLSELARANIVRNKMGDRVEVVSADLTLPLSRTPELASRVGTFHSVVANPPYYDASSGTRASDPLKANAHAMAGGSLDDWARFLAAMAAPDGQLTLIHRADRLDEILAVLDRRFGALTLCPIHSRSTEPANRILITGRKSSRAPLTIRPGLVLHDATGYRSEIEAVLRHGAALPD